LSTKLPLHFSPETCLEAIRYLSHAAGAHGMTGGQTHDMHPVNKNPTIDDLKHMHSLKTGALITAATVIPAILCNATETEKKALTSFGYHLGLLFQITDDILDVTSSEEQLGKTPNKDHQQNKATYVTLLGLENARKFAKEEAKKAKSTVSYFGTKQTTLVQLVDYIAYRKN
jgi:geranylgeranyl pyrophosphate synthase